MGWSYWNGENCIGYARGLLGPLMAMPSTKGIIVGDLCRGRVEGRKAKVAVDIIGALEAQSIRRGGRSIVETDG